jgi:hypothetical protein
MIKANKIIQLIEANFAYNRGSRFGSKVYGRETTTSHDRPVSMYGPFASGRGFDPEELPSDDKLSAGVDLIKMPGVKTIRYSIWKKLAPMYGPSSKQIRKFVLSALVYIHPQDWEEMEDTLKRKYGSFDYMEDQHNIILGLNVGKFHLD